MDIATNIRSKILIIHIIFKIPNLIQLQLVEQEQSREDFVREK